MCGSFSDAATLRKEVETWSKPSVLFMVEMFILYIPDASFHKFTDTGSDFAKSFKGLRAEVKRGRVHNLCVWVSHDTVRCNREQRVAGFDSHSVAVASSGILAKLPKKTLKELLLAAATVFNKVSGHTYRSSLSTASSARMHRARDRIHSIIIFMVYASCLTSGVPYPMPLESRCLLFSPCIC